MTNYDDLTADELKEPLIERNNANDSEEVSRIIEELDDLETGSKSDDS